MDVGQFTYRSPRQARVFAVILAYFARYQCVPSYRALMAEMGWASLNAPAKTMRQLVGDGLLVWRQTPRGKAMLVPAHVRPVNRVKPTKLKT